MQNRRPPSSMQAQEKELLSVFVKRNRESESAAIRVRIWKQKHREQQEKERRKRTAKQKREMAKKFILMWRQEGQLQIQIRKSEQKMKRQRNAYKMSNATENNKYYTQITTKDESRVNSNGHSRRYCSALESPICSPSKSQKQRLTEQIQRMSQLRRNSKSRNHHLITTHSLEAYKTKRGMHEKVSNFKQTLPQKLAQFRKSKAQELKKTRMQFIGILRTKIKQKQNIIWRWQLEESRLKQSRIR